MAGEEVANYKYKEFIFHFHLSEIFDFVSRKKFYLAINTSEKNSQNLLL